MTTPYEQNLPCLNRECKSHGTPHPNCRCYGFADGGDVETFCSKNNPHKKDCEYYMAEGGVAPMLDSNMPASSPVAAPIGNPVAAGPGTSSGFNPEEFLNPGSKDISTHSRDEDSYAMENGAAGFDPDKFLNNDKVGDVDTKAMGEAFDPDAFLSGKAGSDQEGNILDNAKAGAEAFAHGLGGDLATALEVKSGLSTLPAIQGRQIDYPKTNAAFNLAGNVGYYTGAGAATAALLPEAAAIGAGATILTNVAAAMAHEGTDAVGKAMLGQPGGDPQTAVASTLVNGGIQGLMNAATEGLFSGANKLYKDAPNIAKNAMAAAAKNPALLLWVPSIANLGHAAMTGSVPNFVLGELGFYAAAGAAKKGANWVADNYFPKVVTNVVKDITGHTLSEANEWLGKGLTNLMSKTNFLGIPSAVEYIQRTSGGHRLISKPVEALFKAGSSEAIAPLKKDISNKIKDWVEEGGIQKEQQQMHEIQNRYPHNGQGGATGVYADGGEVQPDSQVQQVDHFANAYPAENILLHSARTRISNYLTSLRPMPSTQKAAFDNEPSQKQKQKSYESAIEIAGNPIRILDHVNKGTLTQENLGHFKAMFPEVHDLMAKKMTERITQAQLKGEKPTYSKRQAMSMFLGVPLDSTFDPLAIQTIQATYAVKQSQQQTPAPGKTKKGTAPLSKAPSAHMTDNQAREQRLQNQKA